MENQNKENNTKLQMIKILIITLLYIIGSILLSIILDTSTEEWDIPADDSAMAIGFSILSFAYIPSIVITAINKKSISMRITISFIIVVLTSPIHAVLLGAPEAGGFMPLVMLIYGTPIYLIVLGLVHSIIFRTISIVLCIVGVGAYLYLDSLGTYF